MSKQTHQTEHLQQCKAGGHAIPTSRANLDAGQHSERTGREAGIMYSDWNLQQKSNCNRWNHHTQVRGQRHETTPRREREKLCRQPLKPGNTRLIHPLVVHGSSLWVRTKLSHRLPALSTTHVSDVPSTQRARATKSRTTHGTIQQFDSKDQLAYRVSVSPQAELPLASWEESLSHEFC